MIAGMVDPSRCEGTVEKGPDCMRTFFPQSGKVVDESGAVEASPVRRRAEKPTKHRRIVLFVFSPSSFKRKRPCAGCRTKRVKDEDLHCQFNI